MFFLKETNKNKEKENSNFQINSSNVYLKNFIIKYF